MWHPVYRPNIHNNQGDILYKGFCVFDLYTGCHLGCYVCLTFIQGVIFVVMCYWSLYRVLPWLFCVLGLYTGCDLGCYVFLSFIQGVTLVVMCVWPLYRVSPWLVCVYGLYKGCHLRCYVWLVFIQGVNQGDTLYKGQAHITTKVTPCIKAKLT
jgi:hypothetical protein